MLKQILKTHWLELVAFKVGTTLLILAMISIHHKMEELDAAWGSLIAQQHESFQYQLKMDKMLSDAFYSKEDK